MKSYNCASSLFSFVIILALLQNSALANEDEVFEKIKNLYKASEIVVLMITGDTTIFKEPVGNKSFRIRDERLNFLLFEGRQKGEKTSFGLGTSFRIIDDMVIFKPVASKVSKIPILDIERLLLSLSKAEGFVPVIVD